MNVNVVVQSLEYIHECIHEYSCTDDKLSGVKGQTGFQTEMAGRQAPRDHARDATTDTLDFGYLGTGGYM